MRLLVDGIFFQLASSGIARVWHAILLRLASSNLVDLIILDRGGVPTIPNATIIPFPSYHDRYTADDSLLIQEICDHYLVDVFTSTYYTSPVSTPMLLIIYDMIPELFDFDLTERFWMEKELSIAFARRLICISESTKSDLLRFYPEIPDDEVAVAYPGYDKNIFKVRGRREIEEFAFKEDLAKPYFLMVGSREQHKNYKNAKLFFESLNFVDNVDFDIICIGGEPEIDPKSMALVPSGCRVKRLVLTDEELSLAYSGAEALVYPSLYEGFGLPVVEAMACGCPVITTLRGSLAEIAHGGACLTISGLDAAEMAEAIVKVRAPEIREKMIRTGLERAGSFSWDTLAETVERAAANLTHEARAGAFQDFFSRWKQLRVIQSTVDVQRIA